MALPLYALTLFVSAFILFLVQPIIGKIILPKLGGTPQVWNTCMVFFQMVLLAGYAYTHNVSTRFTLRQQLMAHAVLLLLPLIVLVPFPFALGGEYLDRDAGSITGATNASPIEITAPNHKLSTGMRVTISGIQGNTLANGTWTVNVFDKDKFTLESSTGNGDYAGGGSYSGGMPNPRSIWGFVPALGSNPIPSTLLILFVYVALPFLVVATSAPLLQKWFVYTEHPAAKDPYFLYGASNFGSMLSLIVYPILIEPYLGLRGQAWTYTIGYLCLIAFVLVCASTVWQASGLVGARPKGVVDPLPEPLPAEAPPVPPSDPQTGIAPGPPAGAPGAPTAIKSGQPGKYPPKGGARPHFGTEPNIAQTASDEMTFGRRFRWVMLAMVPSSLMLGITTHVTTDLSPMPLFWLVPLILYLLSFILVFARWPVVWTEQPHTTMVYAQPFCLALMILASVLHLAANPALIGMGIVLLLLGFFTTTMVCHGELAKDRPGPRHLTEFYLWMSVGGMLGGMFNGLIAPIIFPKLWEFPLAIFAAALVRPKMFDVGILDNWLAGIFEGQPDKQAAPAKPGHKGAKPLHQPKEVTANESLVNTLDWVWPVVILVLTVVTPFLLGFFLPRWTTPQARTVMTYGIPLLLCCACMTRPLRFGLGVAAVLLMYQFEEYRTDSSLHSSRSYFGTIAVKEGSVRKDVDGSGNKLVFEYRSLVHGTTLHGQNFLLPPLGEKKGGVLVSERGNKKKDWSRLATTYYHREGPTGRVMEKFNWFPGEQNTYYADMRIPASIVGNLVADLGNSSIPLTSFVTLWSEPPYATVGLGTGTMASYARPYQHVHFYEIDNQIFKLSLLFPTSRITDFAQYDKDRSTVNRVTYYNYLERALERGSSVQVLMGDARLRMAMDYKNHYQDKTDHGGGPENFYHMMVVDAFSSDAIPAHLLTEEAFKMYFSKLADKGILCVHTSNKFADLAKVVAAVADKLKLKHLRGHDSNEQRDEGHTTSEWVMVARTQQDLEHLTNDRAFLERYEAAMRAEKKSPTYWDQYPIDPRYCWTDDYYNLLSVVRFLK